MSDHTVHIVSERPDPSRNYVNIRFACGQPGCLVGNVKGSPAASMAEFVRLIADNHGSYTEREPVAQDPDWYVRQQAEADGWHKAMEAMDR